MQICVTTSTSAGLEQILPWMFYHKIIGVTNFFLFVEGKAASPEVSNVLESIPVSKQTVYYPSQESGFDCFFFLYVWPSSFLLHNNTILISFMLFKPGCKGYI